MPFDARSRTRRCWIHSSWMRRLGAACCGGVLPCVVCLAPAPCAAQSYLQIYSATVIHSGCPEGACECFDDGVAQTCPGSHERYYDSGPIYTNQTFDTHSADVADIYLASPGSGSETRSQVQLNASAFYGQLRGYGWTRAFATGESIEGGGFAFNAEAHATVGASLSDDLTLIGATPGGPVSIRLRQEIGGFDFVLIRGTDNHPVTNFCLANGDATTSLNVVLSTTHLGMTGGGDQSVGYLRRTNECSAPVITGDPLSSIVIDGHDGDFVHVGQTVTIDSYSYMGGGFGLPNRVTYANSYVDASNTARLFVDVLTPGASFTSTSGATYQVPESSGPAGQLAALLVVLGLRRSFRAVTPSAPSAATADSTAPGSGSNTVRASSRYAAT